MAISQANPSLSFIVQDLPYVAENGAKLLPPEYSHKIRFLAHNMNDPQLPTIVDNNSDGAPSLFLFRSVLLNHSDKYVVKFLRNLIPALRPGAKILINEGCLPEPGEVKAWDERLLRNLDLCMAVMFNSKERTVGEWEALFRGASDGFRFLGARRPEQGLLWIVEAEWAGEAVQNGI